MCDQTRNWKHWGAGHKEKNQEMRWLCTPCAQFFRAMNSSTPIVLELQLQDLAEYASSSPDLCASPKTRNLITPELQSQSLALALEVEQTLTHGTEKTECKMAAQKLVCTGWKTPHFCKGKLAWPSPFSCILKQTLWFLKQFYRGYNSYYKACVFCWQCCK